MKRTPQYVEQLYHVAGAFHASMLTLPRQKDGRPKKDFIRPQSDMPIPCFVSYILCFLTHRPTGTFSQNSTAAPRIHGTAILH